SVELLRFAGRLVELALNASPEVSRRAASGFLDLSAERLGCSLDAILVHLLRSLVRLTLRGAVRAAGTRAVLNPMRRPTPAATPSKASGGGRISLRREL